MATLADALRQTGYAQDGTLGTPTPVNSPMTTALAEHIKSIPQKFNENQQHQMDLLARAYPGNTFKSMMLEGDPAAMNELAMQAPIVGMMAYHGTPHKILDKFDISKIGTGEGAQAYGHGIYVAENPAVAKDYADKLSTVGWRRDDAFMDYDAMTMDAIRNDLRHNSLDDIVKQNKQYADSAKQTGEKSVMADMYNAIVSGDVGLNGNLYKADLPDEQIAKMLDYDKTWKQQPKNVQDAINVDKLLKYYGTDDISTSQVLYHAKQNMSPVAFAEFLRSKGVPGIKYLDEGSRAEGQGTRNFVVFPGEEKSMTILERNGLLADQLKALPEEKKKEILNLLDY